jgi:hypothetical protein
MSDSTDDLWQDLIADDEFMTALLDDESFWRDLATMSVEDEYGVEGALPGGKTERHAGGSARAIRATGSADGRHPEVRLGNHTIKAGG